MKRSLAAFGVACSLLIGCSEAPTPSEPVAPQFSTSAGKFPISGTIMHPCTGEPIAYEGTVHSSISIRTRGDVTLIRLLAHTSGVLGVGLTTGTRYVLYEGIKQTQELTVTPPYPYEIDVAFRDRWQSQGSADNFFGTAIYTITFDGVTWTIAFKKLVVDCKG